MTYLIMSVILTLIFISGYMVCYYRKEEKVWEDKMTEFSDDEDHEKYESDLYLKILDKQVEINNLTKELTELKAAYNVKIEDCNNLCGENLDYRQSIRNLLTKLEDLDKQIRDEKPKKSKKNKIKSKEIS